MRILGRTLVSGIGRHSRTIGAWDCLFSSTSRALAFAQTSLRIPVICQETRILPGPPPILKRPFETSRATCGFGAAAPIGVSW